MFVLSHAIEPARGAQPVSRSQSFLAEPQPVTKSPDVVVIGAGIFGLSVARAAVRRGMRVTLVEAAAIGSGASGGVLGALMPHMPARWNAKKAFQFEALAALSGLVADLEAETGLDCGYRRCGRILPITTADLRAHHEARAAEARTRWSTATTGFGYELVDAGALGGWLAPEAAPFGAVLETLAARVSPRAYLAALAASLASAPDGRGQIRLGDGLARLDDATGTVHLVSGDRIRAERIVLAQGFAAFSALAALTGKTLGEGQKGQAIRVAVEVPASLPALYCDGLYVVPHADGSVAIGSTALTGVTDTKPEPAATADLLERAVRFCPQLAGAPVLEAWAGIRPKPAARDPLVGRVPGLERSFVATGGFKTGFGLAHRVAAALVSELLGETPEHPLPASFRPEAHFA
nr:FAD-dependent oxidoreductase [Pannonibacter sp. XCT-34]